MIRIGPRARKSSSRRASTRANQALAPASAVALAAAWSAVPAAASSPLWPASALAAASAAFTRCRSRKVRNWVVTAGGRTFLTCLRTADIRISKASMAPARRS